MAVITVLDKNVSELIAAGEVIERPSSVIKELVENSIDAGATQIDITIVDGGLKRIQVSDNGIGIEKDDIRSAFLPHATSKLERIRDLETLSTLGFRGEALASISSVSEVTLISKTAKDEMASYIYLVGGKVVDERVDARANGTSITVENLFFNTPARMKFLKKDVSEANAVSAVVDRIALSHPEVSIRFIRDGKQAMLTNGNGDLLSTVYSVLGKEVSDSLISVDYEIDNVRVSGYISRPVSCRATRGMQFCFLNSRFIKSFFVN